MRLTPAHPGVDSLVPARSALRAFGFAEFLSRLPKPLKPPQEKENRSPVSWNLVRQRLADVRRAMNGVRLWFPRLGERVRVKEVVAPGRGCVRPVRRSWRRRKDQSQQMGRGY
jgi:hypothetical protein